MYVRTYIYREMIGSTVKACVIFTKQVINMKNIHGALTFHSSIKIC